MKKLRGYICVSTDAQDLKRQEENNHHRRSGYYVPVFTEIAGASRPPGLLRMIADFTAG